MNNHQRRLLLGFVIAVLVLTALFLLLTKTPLVITAYCFSLLAPVMFFGTLYLVTAGTKKQFITSAAFPLQARTYAGLNLSFCVLIVLLARFDVWNMSVKWFAFVHILLLAFIAWRFLAMDSGREEIEKTGEAVQQKTSLWRQLRQNASALGAAADPEVKKQIAAVQDAFRYADPMSDERLAEIEGRIEGLLGQLSDMVRDHRNAGIPELCGQLLTEIRIRNEQCKALK